MSRKAVPKTSKAPTQSKAPTPGPTVKPSDVRPHVVRAQSPDNPHTKRLGYLHTNLSNVSRVAKTNPQSVIPEVMKKAGQNHRELVDKLSRDPTKTTIQADRVAHQSAIKQLRIVQSYVKNDFDRAQIVKNSYEEIVDRELQLAGTTDFLIRASTLEFVRNKSFTEVLGLLKSGSRDLVKASDLPIFRLAFDLDNNPERDYMVRAIQESTFLKPDQSAALSNARTAMDALNAVSVELDASLAKNQQAISAIEESVVTVTED